MFRGFFLSPKMQLEGMLRDAKDPHLPPPLLVTARLRDRDALCEMRHE